MLRRPRRSIREAVLAHSQGDDHALERPIECNGAAQLCGHGPVHQLATETFEHRRSQDRRTAPFGPHHGDFIVVSIA